MPYINRGTEITDPVSGQIFLTPVLVNVTVTDASGVDNEGGSYLVRLKRREVLVDSSDLKRTPEEIDCDNREIFGAMYGDIYHPRKSLDEPIDE